MYHSTFHSSIHSFHYLFQYTFHLDHNQLLESPKIPEIFETSKESEREVKCFCVHMQEQRGQAVNT